MPIKPELSARLPGRGIRMGTVKSALEGMLKLRFRRARCRRTLSGGADMLEADDC